MERKYLAFVLSLPFLFLFYSSSFVFGEKPETKKELWENGGKRLEEHYKDGKLDGLSTYFYENGVKMFEVYYKHGEKNGLKTHWYPNGKTWYERNYKFGKKNGPWTEWYFNEQMKLKGYFKN